MSKKLIWFTALLVAVTVVVSVLYCMGEGEVFLTLAITFGTFAYHFVMRLLVALVFSSVMHNKADYNKRWYRVGKAEMALYNKLKIAGWKGKMPTYDPSQFDPRLHSWDEIAQAMCQAELVHETIVLLSFVPLVECLWFDTHAVFVVTSVLAAAFDLMFVAIQRYNRTRIVRLLERKNKAK